MKKDEKKEFAPVELTKAFRLPKQFKRIMATVTNKVDRDDYKNISIGAHLASLQKPRNKKSDNIVEADE